MLLQNFFSCWMLCDLTFIGWQSLGSVGFCRFTMLVASCWFSDRKKITNGWKNYWLHHAVWLTMGYSRLKRTLGQLFSIYIFFLHWILSVALDSSSLWNKLFSTQWASDLVAVDTKKKQKRKKNLLSTRTCHQTGTRTSFFMWQTSPSSWQLPQATKNNYKNVLKKNKQPNMIITPKTTELRTQKTSASNQPPSRHQGNAYPKLSKASPGVWNLYETIFPPTWKK